MPVEDDNKFEQVAQRQLQAELAEQFKRETLGYIEQIMNQVAVMGANDTELGDLRKIKENFEAKKISAENARALAYEVLKKKQDYH